MRNVVRRFAANYLEWIWINASENIPNRWIPLHNDIQEGGVLLSCEHQFGWTFGGSCIHCTCFCCCFQSSAILSLLMRGTPWVSRPLSPSKEWINWVMRRVVSSTPRVVLRQCVVNSLFLMWRKISSFVKFLICIASSSDFFAAINASTSSGSYM